MNAIQTGSGIALVLLMMAAPGDPPPAPARVVAGLAAPAAGSAATVPPFVLFGWVSPPVESTTAARVAEMATAGLTLALPALDDSAGITGRAADNLARLDLLAARGMAGIVWDDRFERFTTLDPDGAAGTALIDSVVADYAARDALLGWYMGDEPPPGQFDLLGRIGAALRARDPGRFIWNNLLGRGAFATREAWLDHLRDYIARVRPAVLCDDHYDFRIVGDAGWFVENAAGLAAVARASGLPFWCIVQVTPHGPNRDVTPGLLRWQTAHLLAHGARGIGYFTYWTPPGDAFDWRHGLIERDGTRGPLFAETAALGPRLRAAGETLAAATWLATEYAGSCPTGGTPFAPDDVIAAVEGRVALGQFVDASGARLLLVASSDSAAAATVALTLPHAEAVEALGAAPGAWTPLAAAPGDGGARVTLDLAAGDFALLRVSGTLGVLRAGRGPVLRGWPSPARGVVRIAYAGLGGGGRLEVLDAAGRRVWSARPAPGEGLVEWGGERERGGAAPPGVYLARLEDARGVAAMRVVWLGAR